MSTATFLARLEQNNDKLLPIFCRLTLPTVQFEVMYATQNFPNLDFTKISVCKRLICQVLKFNRG